MRTWPGAVSALRAADLPLPLDVVVVAHEPDGENAGLRSLEEFGCTVRPYWGSFDFASMNNLGADGVQTPYLLFINDDVIVRSAGWARTAFGLLGRDDVGMVGTTLLIEAGRSSTPGSPSESGMAPAISVDSTPEPALALATCDSKCVSL